MRSLFHKTYRAFERARDFVTKDIWQIGQPGEKVPSGILVKNIRVVILLTRGITEETLLLRASALTFATLLFIVPFMVFMFAFIQTFDLGDTVYLQLSQQMKERFEQAMDLLPFDQSRDEADEEEPVPPVLESEAESSDEPRPEASGIFEDEGPGEVAQFLRFQPESIQLKPGEGPRRAKEDPLAPVVEALTVDRPMTEEQRKKALWNAMVTFFFPQFEPPESDQVVDYLDPVEMLVSVVEEGATSLEALGVTGLFYVLITVFGFMRNVEWTFNRIWGVVYSRNVFRTFTDYLAITLLLPFVAAVVLAITAALATLDTTSSFRIALRGGQLLLVSLTFGLLYKVVPNTKVDLRCALFGGVMAGIAWMLMSWAYVTFQVGLAKNVFFFSTFALFPLMLFWIYSSWVILLFGSLLTFAYQNEKTFAMEQYVDQASHAYRESVAVRAVVEMTRRFRRGEQPLSIAEMAEQWNVPTRLLNATMQCLSDAHYVTELATEPARYQPGRAPDTTTVADIVRAIRDSGMEPSLLRQEKLYRPLYRGLDEGDNHYLDMTIASMAERLDRKTEPQAAPQPAGQVVEYPRSI